MKKNNLLCSSRLHFFEDKNQQSQHFFDDTFAQNLHFFDDNALYAILESKSTLTKIHHPSIKYRYLCSHPSQQKGLHTKEAKQGLWIHQKHEKCTNKHRNSIVRSLKKLKPKLKPKLEPLFHHEFSAETGSRVKRTQHLNHRSAKR